MSRDQTETDAVTCPDGVVRHTRFVVMDCAVCRPENHTDCGCLDHVSRPAISDGGDQR